MVSMDKGMNRKESLRGAFLKLYVRDVRDRQGRKKAITVRSWSTIKDVKDTIQQVIDVPARNQRLYFGPLLTSGKELPNHRTLHDAGIYRSGDTLLLDIKGGVSSVISPFSLQTESKSDVTISSSVIDSTPRLLRQLVQQARRGLALGLKPEFILEGSGGTYFLHDERKVKIAVFKPADEEPYAENNPRGYLPQPGHAMCLREGVVPGEACIREVAAFMLDHGGFCDVPMTTLVEARHPSFNANGARLKVAEGGASVGAHSISNSTSVSPMNKKVGSFQEFVRSECTMDDLSPSKISVDEVHKIAILDIRLMNADRNSANLLCRRRTDNSIELVPIDHGFCLRSVADISWMDWCWLDWPQMKQPMSKKTKEYILSLDIEKDARILKERLNICREAIDYFCAASSILKAGVRAGLTLYEIATMCCRNDNLGEVPSKLEVLFSMAEELAESAIENGRWHHAAASRALEEQLTPKGESLLSPVPLNGLPKAMSAVDLLEYREELAPLSIKNKSDIVPGMIQSSASDSSSDTGEGDREDCEEWAAALIADVSLDKSMTLLGTKQRSPSIESDSSSDSENGGFWRVPPGSTVDDASAGSDEESISWSPPNSSFFEMSQPSITEEARKSYNPFGSGRRSSIILSDHDFGESFNRHRTPSKVSFAGLENLEHPKREERELEPKFKHSNSDVGESISGHLKPVENKIRRSQSYSALSSTLAEKSSAADDENTKMLRPIDQEQHRDYFLKFVDLVIVRETTATARLTKQMS